MLVESNIEYGLFILVNCSLDNVWEMILGILWGFLGNVSVGFEFVLWIFLIDVVL